METSECGPGLILGLPNLEAARAMARYTHIVAVISVLEGHVSPGDPANPKEWANLPFLWDALCAAENYEDEECEFVGRLFQEAAAVLPAFFREPAQMERMASMSEGRLPSEFVDGLDCESCSRGEESPAEARMVSVRFEAREIWVGMICRECGEEWATVYAFKAVRREENDGE